MFRICLALIVLPTLLAGQHSVADTRAIPLLRTIRDTIAYHHPAAQSAATRAALRLAYDDAELTLQQLIAAPGDSIGVQDFILTAATFQRQLQDGHLQLRPHRSKAWKKAHKDYRRPSTYLTADDQLILVTDLPTNQDTLRKGTEILAFNGQPVADLIDQLTVFSGLNDEGYDRAARVIHSKSLAYHYQERYGYRDSLTVTYLVPETGSTRDAAIGMLVPEAADATDDPPTRSAKKRARKETEAKLHEKFLSLKKAPDSSAWILTVRSFSDSRFKHANYGRLLKQSFAKINESGLGKLILDLRVNGGGDMGNARTLIRYLVDEPFVMVDEVVSTAPTAGGVGLFQKYGLYVGAGVRKRNDGYHLGYAEKVAKPMRNGFRGDLVVLVDEGTFSASTLVARTLDVMDVGVLVGTRTGGGTGTLFGGKLRKIILGEKNELQLSLIVPVWTFKPLGATPGTVTPDVIISFTKEDLLKDISPMYTKALEILNGDFPR
ncbi:hypothetical protein GGR27_000634 [Lewinella antarctica]|uniref:Tail specific protease domain-containing protein n=2 Tax=Neolewinella antarctica TaxID=442734 RepID=A0ABX0X809_9BACT|nr:hypothetical protein [Neolewinella antarctica]